MQQKKKIRKVPAPAPTPAPNVTALQRHLSCKAYVMHGFVPEKESDSHIIGICPFCGKRGKMYVNKETKAWDCKSASCRKSGGFRSFLLNMQEYCERRFKGENAIRLSKLRGIQLKTLQNYHIGYNDRTQRYCIPIFGSDTGTIFDLRMFAGGKMLSTAGCKTSLFGLNNLVDSQEDTDIYLCEGEWDTMIMSEVLNGHNALAVGVPGASTFKQDWCAAFRGRNVNVLFDNDAEGIKGSVRAFNVLSGVAAKISFLNWTLDKAPKYDISNLYEDSGKDSEKTLQYIHKSLRDEPLVVNESKKKPDEDDDNENVVATLHKPASRIKFTGNGMPVEDVYHVYQEELHLPDVKIIDFLFGTIIANRLPGCPVWAFIVAPSGMTKSELIMSVSGAKGIHAEDNFSKAGLISGFIPGGVDHSLIPFLNGKTLCVKDFTTIMSKRFDERHESLGMLRALYDGKYRHKYGNTHKDYVSKFGIISGVTESIGQFLEDENELGPRFICYPLRIPETLDEEMEYVHRARMNTFGESGRRHKLNSTASRAIDYDFESRWGDVQIPVKMGRRIEYLATLVAMLRGSVTIDKYTKEIQRKPNREIGTRLSQQFTKLLSGVCLFRRVQKATSREFSVLHTVALGTAPSRLVDIVYGMFSCGINEHYETKELMRFSKLPQAVTSLLMKSLVALEVCVHRVIGVRSEYAFSDKAKLALLESEVFKECIM